MPYADIDRLRLYYEEAGEGEPLVLLLGGTGALGLHPAAWGALLPTLSAHYRTFHVEQRGHGRTNNPSGEITYRQMAADTAAFIERLDLGPAHVAGMSDGAIVGLVLGMTRPDLMRSLVCVGANYCLDDQLRAALQHFSPEAMERDAPDWVAAMVAAHDPHHGPGYWRDLVRQVAANAYALDYTEADLQTIPTPTLLIAGETDDIVSLDQMLAMRRSIPRAEMLVLNHAGLDPGANHNVQHTRPEIVGPIMLDFLDRHSDAERG